MKNFCNTVFKKIQEFWSIKRDKSILEYEASPLDLLYVMAEIEQRYNLSAKDIIDKTTPDSFTIEQLSKLICEKMGN